MGAPFTPKQEARIREIAREEMGRAAIAMSADVGRLRATIERLKRMRNEEMDRAALATTADVGRARAAVERLKRLRKTVEGGEELGVVGERGPEVVAANPTAIRKRRDRTRGEGKSA